MAPPERRLSALPSVRARVLAFAAIVAAGLAGALIGFSFVSVQCRDGCPTAAGVGALVGALSAAGGVAVVSVLALRAMNEWRTLDEEELLGGDERVSGEEPPRPTG